MKADRKYRTAMIVGIGLGLLMPLHRAMAEVPLSMEELSAQWWQWVLSIPTPDNPLLDPTGAKCAEGQQGPVWFIPVGGSGTRTCSLPGGKPLVFPTLCYVNVDTPNVCGQGPASMPVSEMRAAAAAVIDGVTNQVVEFDGQAIVNVVRVQSPEFEVVLPEDNWFDPQCTAVGDVPGGTYSPAIVDGYWVMLDPPSPGEHTLYVHAEVQGSAMDVTYDLTIAAIPCAGDCNNDGEVLIPELIVAVTVALGQDTVSRCFACDRNGDSLVTIDELIKAVSHALLGC